MTEIKLAGGYYCMHRRYWNDSLFKKEPFTEREAWHWLIANAAYEPHKYRYKSQIVSLTRGQVPTSYRDLKDDWQWGNDRVRRFLDLLESDEKISRGTGTGFLVITILNYEKYQIPLTETGTQAGTVAGTHTGTQAGTNIINNKKNNKKDNSPADDSAGDNDTRKPKNKYPDAFEAVWTIWPLSRRCEKPNAFKAWQEACKKIEPAQLLECVKRYLQTPEANPDKNGVIFAPYPAKWFRRQRWLEVAQEVTQPAGTPFGLAELGGDTADNRAFLRILESLKAHYGDAIFRSWFVHLRIVRRCGDVLQLQAPSRFMCEHMTNHYSSDIAAAARAVWPEIRSIRIELAGKP